MKKGGRGGKREKSHETFPDPTRSMCTGVWQGRGEPVIGVLSKGSRSLLHPSKQPLLLGPWQIWALGFWQRQENQKFSIKAFQLLREREDEGGRISQGGCQG